MGGIPLPSFCTGPSIERGNPAIPWLVRFTMHRELAMLRSVGFNPYLPREYGGPGFPGPPGAESAAVQALRPQWARAVRVCMSQGALGGFLLARLSNAWSVSSMTRHQDLTDWVEEAIQAMKSEYGRARGDGDDLVLTLDQLVREVVGGLTASFDLARGFPVVHERSITPRSVYQRVQKALDDLNRRVPYPRLTDRPRNLTKGLLAYLVRIRTEFFRVPPEFRSRPRLGAAEVGPMGHMTRRRG